MRTAVIVFRLLPLVVSFLRDHRRFVVAGKPLKRAEAFHLERAARLVHTLAVLGPTFVKLAQVFASRADVVPEPYLTALGTLTDQVPAVPFAAVSRTIEASYGERLEAHFDEAIRRDLRLNGQFGVTRADDTLPDRFLHEPLPDGPTRGSVVNLPKMLGEYYRLHDR